MGLAWAVHRLAVLLAGPAAESADEVQAAHAALARTLVHALAQARVCAVADAPASTSLAPPLDAALVQDAVDLLLGTLPQLAGPAVPAPLLLDVLCSTDRFVLVQACLLTIIRAAGAHAGDGSTAASTRARPVLAPRQWSLVVRKVWSRTVPRQYLMPRLFTRPAALALRCAERQLWSFLAPEHIGDHRDASQLLDKLVGGAGGCPTGAVEAEVLAQLNEAKESHTLEQHIARFNVLWALTGALRARSQAERWLWALNTVAPRDALWFCGAAVRPFEFCMFFVLEALSSENQLARINAETWIRSALKSASRSVWRPSLRSGVSGDHCSPVEPNRPTACNVQAAGPHFGAAALGPHPAGARPRLRAAVLPAGL